MLDPSAQIIKEPLWMPRHDHDKETAFMGRFYRNIDEIVDTTKRHKSRTEALYEFEYLPGLAAGGACYSMLKAVQSIPTELVVETDVMEHEMLKPCDFTFGDDNSRARLLWAYIEQSENRDETYGVCFADRQLELEVFLPLSDYTRRFTVTVTRGLPLDSSWFGRPLTYELVQEGGKKYDHFR